MKKQLLTLFILMLSMVSFAEEPIVKGKNLYTSRCGNCHKINEVFVGPALADVDKRRKSDWIINFVQSSQTMVKAGDADAVALFAKFKVPMPDHKDLSETDVSNIIEYIKNESKAVANVAKAPFAKPTQSPSAYAGINFKESKGILLCILVSVALLIGALFFFAKVKTYEQSKVW